MPFFSNCSHAAALYFNRVRLAIIRGHVARRSSADSGCQRRRSAGTPPAAQTSSLRIRLRCGRPLGWRNTLIRIEHAVVSPRKRSWSCQVGNSCSRIRLGPRYWLPGGSNCSTAIRNMEPIAAHLASVLEPRQCGKIASAILSDGVFAAAFRQDPRYYRKGFGQLNAARLSMRSNRVLVIRYRCRE